MKIDDNVHALIEKYVDSFSIWEGFHNKTFVITGANGALGKGLIHLLIAANERYNLNVRVFGSTRNPSISNGFIEESDPIKYVHYGKEAEELCGESVDFIIHAASPTERDVFMVSPKDVFCTIVHDTERIIRLADEKNAKMLYLSSDAEYGSWSSEKPINESEFGAIDSLNYRSCYPLGKKASEFLCYSSVYQNKSNVVIARPSIILGVFQKYEDSKVMSYFLRCLVEQKNIVLNTPGETVKPMVFTLDAAMACLFLLLFGKSGEAYNVTNTEICMSIRDYAEKLCKRFGENIKVEYNFISDAKAGFAATSKLALNTDKLLATGWYPLISFEELFSIEIRRFKNNETN